MIEIRVGPVAHGGWCVARYDGQVVFVRHTLPGELVKARVIEETNTRPPQGPKRFLRADAVEILEASPDRVEPPCPFAGPGRCGGCDWQHATAEAQRRLKASVVSDQLKRIAGLDVPVTVEALGGGLGWRTRVRFAVRRDGVVGFRRHRSHEVEPVDACLIAHPSVEELAVERRRWKGAREVEAVVSSTGDHTVVTGSRGRRSVVRGRPHVVEEARGRRFRVSEGGFWQVHPEAAGALLDAVLELGAPREGETALDLYCGAGLFAAGLAEAVGPGGRVLGIESEASAVRDARYNLRDLPGARVERGRAEESLARLEPRRATLAVADPPRAGLGRAVVDGLVRLAPGRIVYVSCDPATMARDIAWLREGGYSLDELRAYDAFPMTHHVECVALLTRLDISV